MENLIGSSDIEIYAQKSILLYVILAATPLEVFRGTEGERENQTKIL